MITIELYEMARRLAGVPTVEVDAATLRDALSLLGAAHPALVPDVVANGVLAKDWRAGLDGKTWLTNPDHPLAPGDRLVLVSAIAGG